MDQNLFNEICLEQLKLSAVHEGETVAVLTRGAERGEYADAFLWAAQQLGASTYHMRLPAPASAKGAWAVGDSGLGDIPLAVEALKAADMLVDLTFLLFSKEQFAIQDAGTRILTAVEPRAAAGAADAHPRAARARRVRRRTAGQGHDHAHHQPGRHRRHLPAGRLPDDERVRLHRHPRPLGPLAGGVRVHRRRRRRCRRADRALPRRRAAAVQHLRADPGTLTIEKGFIQDIRGGLDADLLSSYIQTFDDPRGYGMSHVGWGLDERAHWHGLTQFGGGMGMELRSFYGNVMFSIGPNNELGGPNDTPCHFDIPMRGYSLYLDDELIVDKGGLTIPEMRPGQPPVTAMTSQQTEPELLVEITFTVNGTVHRERVSPRMHAADFLRQRLGLTGTHVGCEQGVCGMCTVLLDGEAVKGCLLLAAARRARTADGRVACRGRRAGAAAAGLQGLARPAVRLLHPGLPDDRDGAARVGHSDATRRDPRGAERRPLPLHRLRGDRDRGRPGVERERQTLRRSYAGGIQEASGGLA